jgi:hypothetical protein
VDRRNSELEVFPPPIFTYARTEAVACTESREALSRDWYVHQEEGRRGGCAEAMDGRSYLLVEYVCFLLASEHQRERGIYARE